MENIAISRAATYSVLAHIKNNGTLVGGTLDVFIPIVKKGLHLMVNEYQKNQGESLMELHNILLTAYGLDFPVTIIDKILRKIAREVNLNEDILCLHQDGSFIIKEYIFQDYDNLWNEIRRSMREIEELFIEFCDVHSIVNTQGDSLIKFIEKNKLSLSRYLSDKPEVEQVEDFSIEARFINFFKTYGTVYSQIKNIYLGAMLSSYLEFTPSDSVEMSVDILLDTNFVVSLLDLNTPESTYTCNKLLEVCDSLGYTFHILNDTIEEIQSLIRQKASTMDRSFMQAYINKEDILNACERRKLTKVDLERIADNIESKLSERAIYKISDTTKLKNIATYSNEYETFKKYRPSDRAALHDAMCVCYVKEKRGNKKIYDFDKVTAWVVNNAINKNSPNKEIDSPLSSGKEQPAIIKADDLLNVLWLSCPKLQTSIESDTIEDIGLTSLLASTINNSLPKSMVIRELELNVQKYKDENITDKDVILLSSRIANGDLSNIEELNKLAVDDTPDFIRKIRQEVQAQEEANAVTKAQMNEMLERVVKKVELLEKIELQKTNELIAIQEKEDKEVELRRRLLKSENDLRAIRKREFVNNRVAKWRVKSWAWASICLLLVVVFVVIVSNYYSTWAQIWQILSGVLTLSLGVVQFVVAKLLYDKYGNHSNIEAYKKTGIAA